MIRHPTTLTKIRLHCRSVATAAKPRAPDTVPYLYKWSPEPETPLRTPTPKVWSRPQQPVAPPSNSKPSEISVHNPDFQPSIVPLAARAAPPERLNKWARPVAPPSNSKPSGIPILNSEAEPSIASFPTRKGSQPKNNASQSTSSSPDSGHANSLPTFVEDPYRAIGTAPPSEKLNKWSRPVTLPSNSNLSEMSVLNSNSRPPEAQLAAQKVLQPKNNAPHPTLLSPDSHLANSSPTLAKTHAEYPNKAIRSPPPEMLNKWSRPVTPSPSQISVPNSESRPSIAPLAAQKVSQPKNEPTSQFPNSEHANSSPTLAETPAEHPSIAVRAALSPEKLNKWSRPSDSILSKISTLNSNSRPSMAPLTPPKVSQPENKPTLFSPDTNSSPILTESSAEHLNQAIRATPPEKLNKWSPPVTPHSNSVLSRISAINSKSRPSMAPLTPQKVSQPENKPTSLSPDRTNSSPTLTEKPAEHLNKAIRAAPPPENLNKWSPPVAPPSNNVLSQMPAINSNSLQSMAPHETLKKSRPVVPSSNSNLSEMSVLKSHLSQPSKAPPTVEKVLKPKSNVSLRTPLSSDSNRANQSLEETSRPQTPPRLEYSSSLDTDPDNEFTDKRLRPDRNQKSYFEGRGRFERVSSKSLLLQSANNPLSKKKASTVPKLIKARRMDIFIPSTISVAALATLLNVKLARLQQQMKRAGMESESSYDHILTSDYAVLLAEEFGRNPIVDDEAAFDIHPPVAHSNPSSLPSRPPIVTIMGHVDHGKTTLLDTLRSASVAKGEAGGITQHIGAFSVPVNQTGSGPKSITFLDTPGHAAFSAMRARGANVTDIIVLVVAADDGIMPQTKEVINLFKRDDSQVSLVVAINKIDKPNVDLDSVKHALMAEGIQVEDFGGDIPSVNVSGLTGEGLPELLETLSLVAEMQDLRAEHTGSIYGHVLESNVQKGLGPVATILIHRGCLKAGTHVLSGVSHAKVKRMNDSNGKAVKVAIPGMAVTVSGWKILPKAGDIVLDGSENDIKKAISNRERRQELEALHQDVDAINTRRQQHRDLRSSGEDEAPPEPVSSGPLELKLIIKADVSGSAEAVRDALHGMGNTIARVQVISTGVGEISESDIMMAKAANATVVGFSVTASRSVQNNATQNDVPVCTSDIIYRLVDDVRKRVTALLPVIVETKVTGEATILQLFDIDLKQKQTMKIAGCRVTNGIIEKQKFARVLRNGDIIFDGTLSTMRHIKKDITEARKGTECGLGFGEFRDLEAGDLIQMYEKIEKPGVL